MYKANGKKRSWTVEQLRKAVATSFSHRQVLFLLKLRPTGGNYDQLKKYIRESSLATDHFRGKAWNKGLHLEGVPRISLEDILVKDSTYQSYKLKKRLFKAGLKKEKCELCGWSVTREDGSLPLELDHINGDRHDNRIENLRILCPNCHSLQATHRGKNRARFSKIRFKD